MLDPPKEWLIHGDLHFDNILVQWDCLVPNQTVRAQFKLIDPKGTPDGTGVGDCAIDFGRLLWSCRSYYDLLRKGYLVYTREHDDREWSLGWTEWVPTSISDGASGDRVTSYESGDKSIALHVYDHCTGVVESITGDFAAREGDHNLLCRAQFYGSVAMCTVASLICEQDEQGDDRFRIAEALWLHGTRKLDEWAEEYMQ